MQSYWTNHFADSANLNKASLSRRGNTENQLMSQDTNANVEISSIFTKVIKNLGLEENIQDTSQLFVKENWPRMASIFARDLAVLLDIVPTERLSAYQCRDGQGDREK